MPRAPEFYPTRSGSTVTLDLVNPDPGLGSDIIVRRAEEQDINFTRIVVVPIGDFPHSDIIPDTSKRFKYKLSYAFTESQEFIDTSMEIINTSTEIMFQENSGVRSISKFTDKEQT